MDPPSATMAGFCARAGKREGVTLLSDRYPKPLPWAISEGGGWS